MNINALAIGCTYTYQRSTWPDFELVQFLDSMYITDSSILLFLFKDSNNQQLILSNLEVERFISIPVLDKLV